MIRLLLTGLFLAGLACATSGAPPALTPCNSGGITGTTMSCVVGTVVEGNTVVCFASAQSSTATVTFGAATVEPAGWISNPTGFPKRGATTSTYAGYLLRAVAPGGALTVVATFSTSVTGELTCASYAGIQSFDTSVSGNGASGTALSAGAMTTAQTNELIVAGGMVKTGSLTFTAGSGFTVEKQRAGGSESVVLEDSNTTTAGSYTAAATASGAGGEWTFGALAFQTLNSNLFPTNSWRATQGGLVVTGEIGSNQGIARTDTLAITSACYPTGCASASAQYRLTSWTMDGNGLPLTKVEDIDCSGDAPGAAAFTQLNGIFYRSDTDRIYVSAADYGASSNSYILEYNPANLAGHTLATHTVRALNSEGAFWNPVEGTWWVYYVNTNNVDEYNSSWSLIRTHSVPTGPPEQGFQWQAFLFDTDGVTAYGNPHQGNTDHNVWVYSFDGLDFQYRGTFPQVDVQGSGGQSGGSGQGLFFWRNQLYWVSRAGTPNTNRIFKESWPSRRVGR